LPADGSVVLRARPRLRRTTYQLEIVLGRIGDRSPPNDIVVRPQDPDERLGQAFHVDIVGIDAVHGCELLRRCSGVMCRDALTGIRCMAAVNDTSVPIQEKVNDWAGAVSHCAEPNHQVIDGGRIRNVLTPHQSGREFACGGHWISIQTGDLGVPVPCS